MKTDSLLRHPFFCALFGSAVLSVIIPLSGCLAVAAGARVGVVAYVRGDLETTLATDYNRAVDAARRAVKVLEFAQVSDHQDASKAVVVARTPVDKKVEISIANAGKNLTDIKIRVDLFGDEQLSRAILEKIKAEL